MEYGGILSPGIHELDGPLRIHPVATRTDRGAEDCRAVHWGASPFLPHHLEAIQADARALPSRMEKGPDPALPVQDPDGHAVRDRDRRDGTFLAAGYPVGPVSRLPASALPRPEDDPAVQESRRSKAFLGQVEA